jgi:hypothetical protein
MVGGLTFCNVLGPLDELLSLFGSDGEGASADSEEFKSVA